ncbi:helix-turn-helix domain-containing protein [Dysosmobacter welbionis]|uniref:helix-turn-helix domain-containing protein n=2 Tax=Eubacteriales TaxID=186802 RepID=UPI002943D335|nr:helix-turn-helix domain-containing protein [Dysosmobacter welbionis]
MKKEIFKSYEELPLMLSVPEMAAALGISRAGAYELARSEGFPALRIGTRIVIPKDELREWIRRNMGKQETQ